MKRECIVILFVLGVFLLGPQLIKAQGLSITNELECKSAGASWNYISPENAPSRYECVCEEYSGGLQTKSWNGTFCVVVTEEMRCVKTQGVWEENKCACKNGEWVSGYGCNYQIHNPNYILYLIVGIIVLVVLIILLVIWRKSHGKKL